MYFLTPQLDTRPYFRILHDQLIPLLEDLTPDEWHAPTVASKWCVKDVAAHLLDGDIRTLSIQRDKYFGESGPESNQYDAVVKWLNRQNAEWVKSSKRISPYVLTTLHKATAPLVTEYYESLDLLSEAIFPVQWAGEEKSLNWMHLAREYSEKWHHQQQIADATGRIGVLTRELFNPLIMTFMLGIPNTLSSVSLNPGDTVCLHTTGAVEASWNLIFHQSNWEFTRGRDNVRTEITLPSNIAWKLFSKSLRPHQIKEYVNISGDKSIGEKVVNMVSVMA